MAITDQIVAGAHLFGVILSHVALPGSRNEPSNLTLVFAFRQPVLAPVCLAPENVVYIGIMSLNKRREDTEAIPNSKVLEDLSVPHLAAFAILAISASALASCYSSDQLNSGAPDSNSDSDVMADGYPYDAWDADSNGDTTWDGDMPADLLDVLSDAVSEDDMEGIGDDTPVAVLTGPPVAVTVDGEEGGVPELAWNGNGWGAAWGTSHTDVKFRPLDPMASPLGPSVSLGSGFRAGTSLEWKDDHYGIGGTASDDHNLFALIDAMGSVTHGPSEVAGTGHLPDVTWSDQAGGWLLGTTLDYSAQVSLFSDDDAAQIGETLTVSDTGHCIRTRTVSLKSRVSVVWLDESGLRFRSFRWPFVEDSTPSLIMYSFPTMSNSKMSAIGYFDDTIVVIADGENVMALVVEPYVGSVISGPNVIGHSNFEDGSSDMVAVMPRGYVGVCYTDGPGSTSGSGGGDDEVLFRLMTPDGFPVGAELVVDSGAENNGGDCSIAWSGGEFLVAYWRCFEGLFVQRVTPLI